MSEGLYLVEWGVGGKRRRESAVVTAAQALNAQRRKKHELEGRMLGVPGFEQAGEKARPPALHVAVRNYLTEIETMKKWNTYRKYNSVLNRFLDFFQYRRTIDQIDRDDLTAFVIALKRQHRLSANTILHNIVIVAQFFKRHGRGGITKNLSLPDRI